jgi:hypothetical protein
MEDIGVDGTIILVGSLRYMLGGYGLAQDRDHFRALVDTVLDFRVA